MAAKGSSIPTMKPAPAVAHDEEEDDDVNIVDGAGAVEAYQGCDFGMPAAFWARFSCSARSASYSGFVENRPFLLMPE
jgi:hypothetical protein